jgi:Rod binding domain-containing protein
MDGGFALPAPGLQPIDLAIARQSAPAKLGAAGKERAKAASQSFEAVFLNSMFEHMFAGIDGEGPFGGSGATKVWRSFLTDAYAKNLAKAGGIGIADQVYRSLISHQEAAS